MVCLQQERPIDLFQTEKGFFSRLHHKEINFSVNLLQLSFSNPTLIFSKILFKTVNCSILDTGPLKTFLPYGFQASVRIRATSEGGKPKKKSFW